MNFHVFRKTNKNAQPKLCRLTVSDMNERDSQATVWKWVSIALIVVMLCYGGYKGYLLAQEKVAEYIETEVDARVEAIMADEREATKRQLIQKEANTIFAAKCAFVEGYYAHMMGVDYNVPIGVFVEKYEGLKKYLPYTGEEFDKIVERIEEDNADCLKQCFNEILEQENDHPEKGMSMAEFLQNTTQEQRNEIYNASVSGDTEQVKELAPSSSYEKWLANHPANKKGESGQNSHDSGRQGSASADCVVEMEEAPRSSCFSYIGYDEENETLYAVFRESGIEYVYYNFTADDWDSFYNADSLGKYFNAHIKENYEYEKIGEYQGN